MKLLNKTARKTSIGKIVMVDNNGYAIATDSLAGIEITKLTDLPAGAYYSESLLCEGGAILYSDDDKETCEGFHTPIKHKGECKTYRLGKASPTLLDDLSFVARAQSKEATRYYLNGICFKGHNIVATDGHRLHRLKTEHDFTNSEYSAGSIVPRAAMDILISLLRQEKKSEADLMMELYPKSVKFTLCEYTLSAELIEGTYPEYERVIPQYNTNPTLLNLKEFAPVLKRYKILQKSMPSKYLWAPYACIIGKEAIIKSNNGDITDRFPISANIEMGIRINLNYLKDAISGTAAFGKTPNDAIRIDNEDKTVVIMPMRKGY